MAEVVNPPPNLGPRDEDPRLPEDLFARIPPFSRLEKSPSLGKFPGAVVLRRFRKGEVICRQGAAGWTAFYVLSPRDLIAFRDDPLRQAEANRAEKARLQGELGETEQALRQPDLAPKQADALNKKADQARKKILELEQAEEPLRAARLIIEREIEIDASDDEAIAAGEQARRALLERQGRAEADGDREAAALIRKLLTGDTADREAHARAVRSTDPELSRLLGEVVRGDAARTVATVHLAIPRPRGRSRSLIRSIGRALFGGDRRRKRRPTYIPFDGPRDLDYESREGALFEGELFGEMSCMYRTPRSATVVAARDCYMVEMLRNVLDMVRKDAAFKARMDAVFRERVLALQLRELPLLAQLDDDQLERIRTTADLVELEAGDLIYDENDRSDGMHLIRSGIVKVVKDASFLLNAADVKDWSALTAELATPATEDEPSPTAHVASLLPGPIRQLAADGVPEGQRQMVVDALNDLLKDGAFGEAGPFAGLARERRLGRLVWQRLAAPGSFSERAMNRCQRQVLRAVFAKLPEGRADFDGDDDAHLFRGDELCDKAILADLNGADAKPGEPKRWVWERLSAASQAAIAAAKAGSAPEGAAAAAVAADLNTLIRGRPFLVVGAFLDLVRSRKGATAVREFLPEQKTWSSYDFHRFARAFNRFVLEAALPGGLVDTRARVRTPRTISYYARGEPIGELGLIDAAPRTATCVAYNHPEDDPDREVGPVQLVKIRKDIFEELKQGSEAFRRSIEEVARARKAGDVRRLEQPVAEQAAARLLFGEGEGLGLVEGQKLMLINLDRCTRCDECVQACVDTHDDGRSRLFLDGPRFGNFLVPTTCRSCLDPVCMIGCPVGSIHRGGNLEIIIEDWCIGCEKCAKQCPYGAIQMHDIGVVAEDAFGWRFADAATLPEDGWQSPGHRDGSWLIGRGPFVDDREFREQLRDHAAARGARNGRPAGQAVAFRFAFEVPADVLRSATQFQLTMLTPDEQATVWINDRRVVPPPESDKIGAEGEKRKRPPRKGKVEEFLQPGQLRKGRNVVAARVQLPAEGGKGDALFELRIDEVRRPDLVMEGDELSQKVVVEQAVVCDLCSAQFGKVPACVTACPHDAAIRIDARSELDRMLKL